MVLEGLACNIIVFSAGRLSVRSFLISLSCRAVEIVEHTSHEIRMREGDPCL